MTRFAAHAQTTRAPTRGTAPDHASALHGAARRSNRPLQVRSPVEDAAEWEADQAVKGPSGRKLHQRGPTADKAAAPALAPSGSTLSPSMQPHFESPFRNTVS